MRRARTHPESECFQAARMVVVESVDIAKAVDDRVSNPCSVMQV